MMKKVISLILIAAMAFTIVPAVTAQSQTTFTDVPSTHWAASAIAEAVQAGYVSGYPDGTFRPDQEVTREQFIKMAVEALGYDISKYAGSGAGLWSLPYLQAAAAEGLIDPEAYGYPMGYSPDTSKGERPHTTASVQIGDRWAVVRAGAANWPMSRLEIAEVAVRAIGMDPANEYEIDGVCRGARPGARRRRRLRPEGDDDPRPGGGGNRPDSACA